MKIGDLVVGKEYAVHRYDPVDSIYGRRPVRAELVRLVKPWRGPRTCEFRLLEDATWSQFDDKPLAGAVVNLSARNAWRPWEEQEAINAAKDEERRILDANKERVREALGQLGLHDQRYSRADTDLANYEISLSGAELIKLADRAIPLVELERLVYELVIQGSRPLTEVDSDIIHWARHHFSMLEESAKQEDS